MTAAGREPPPRKPSVYVSLECQTQAGYATGQLLGDRGDLGQVPVSVGGYGQKEVRHGWILRVGVFTGRSGADGNSILARAL
jgi:hypothetical protein